MFKSKSILKPLILINSSLMILFLLLSLLLYSICNFFSGLLTVYSALPGYLFNVLMLSGVFFCAITTLSIIRRQEVFKSINTRRVWMGYAVWIMYMLTKNIKQIDSSAFISQFININNEFILKQLESTPIIDNIMILLPHCIQLNTCPIKVTSNVRNCKECGKCNVGDLLKLADKYSIEMYVASGGTLARKILEEKQPELVIAVACERDLMSGIQDTINLPVIGVFNERPNGPCFNTNVNVDKIDAILTKVMRTPNPGIV